MFGRRGFLKMLGLGAAAAATAPIKKQAAAVEEVINSGQFDKELAQMYPPIDAPPELLSTTACSGTIGDSQTLSDILSSQGGSGTLDFIWGPELDFQHGLKPDRLELRSDISYFMLDDAQRGCIVSHDLEKDNVVKKQFGNEEPVGILLNDVVNIDLSAAPLRYYSDEVQLGGKVRVCTQGEFVTTVDGDPKPGDTAYSMNGVLTNQHHQHAHAVGTFLSSKDEDGFAKVKINIS